MDRLRALAIQVAQKIVAEEREAPGSQTSQNLDVAKHFLAMIGDDERGEAESLHAQVAPPPVAQNASSSPSR